ncbi:sulfurtransferase [uncultured Thiodictyon sp.]|uniref:sulfurtransferase n=1 Tax=uncultured Thiodictyon sp. TaxID=1846217 RepID=UPI0025CBC81D|nr:sulfurtransferase [uncultured Thiodictyon sp.]
MPHDPHLIDCRTLAAVSDIVVFDCRFNLSDPGWGERVYREGHLPGARFADLNRDLSSPIGPTSGRHPLPDAEGLACKLGLWGVDRSVQVAVYDDAGGAFAVRLWWLLRWLGHPAVALLDGGLQAWSAMGGDLTAGLPQPQPRRFEAHVNDAAWVTSAELVAGRAENRLQVIDARAPVRFRGESEPIDRVAGHIPGAINLPLQGNLTADGRFLSPGQLRARFLGALGERPPHAAVHSCGSGVNACHNLLAMEVAGLSGSKLYAGSWSEWIRDPQGSVARGD